MTEASTAPGLDGFAAAETPPARVNGEVGELVIDGCPVAELSANARIEETLVHRYGDRLPSVVEPDALKAALADQ